MKPKEATTLMDMSNEFYKFFFSQVVKLEVTLLEVNYSRYVQQL